jgi:hypothetical protein
MTVKSTCLQTSQGYGSKLLYHRNRLLKRNSVTSVCQCGISLKVLHSYHNPSCKKGNKYLFQNWTIMLAISHSPRSSLRNNGPSTTAALKENQTVRGAGCSGASSWRLGFSLPYIRLFCVLKIPFTWKFPLSLNQMSYEISRFVSCKESSLKFPEIYIYFFSNKNTDVKILPWKFLNCIFQTVHFHQIMFFRLRQTVPFRLSHKEPVS